MAKSMIKRMLESKISNYKVTVTSKRLRFEEWEASTGRRWKVTGSIWLPSGRVVEVVSNGFVDMQECTTCLYMTVDGRRYMTYFEHATRSEERIRRLAVAFAKRVMEEAKRRS